MNRSLSDTVRPNRIILTTLFLLLAACGSSDDEDSFTVSATAGAGGNISPQSIEVVAGNTASFTVSANDGFTLASVSGCGGELSGVSYTTAAITADCTVSATFSAATAETLTGVFVDAAVENIRFETATQSGRTNADGEFLYVAGEQVTFALGELEFPPTAAAELITPIDILGASSVSDDAVVNMVRLMMSLDVDGDAANGIQLSDAAADVATANIDFFVSTADFAANAAVTSLIQNAGQQLAVTQLVSVDAALAHFEASLAEQDVTLPGIVGVFSEVSRAENEDTVADVIVVFFSDGSYYFVEVENAVSGNDFEVGSYDYQLKKLSATATLDTNDEIGLNGAEDVPLELTASGFELSPADVSAAYVFDRVAGETGSITGGWVLREEDKVVFVFEEDGTFTAMQPTDGGGSNTGFEWGSYTFNSQTGALAITLTVDTSGDSLTSGGGFDSAAVEADVLTITITGEGDAVFDRIK